MKISKARVADREKRVARYLALAVLGFSLAASADDRNIGRDAFERVCASCHNDENPAPRAMKPSQLAKLPPEQIYRTQFEGVMALYSAALNELEQRAVGQYLSEIPWGTIPDPEKSEKLVRCETSPAIATDALSKPHWIGWGLDFDNSHFQPGEHAGLSAADLANLELKWVYGLPGATSVSTQGAVLGDRIFFGNLQGSGIYSVDAKKGCVHWKYKAKGGARSGFAIGQREDGRFTLYIGDTKAWLYALDADTGEVIWTDKADDHRDARLTATPVLYNDVLYVPVASFEELSGGQPKYECCIFRGSVIAYEAATGKRLWKSYTIVQEPQKTTVSDIGTQQWGPSGAAVWSEPVIDEARGVLYVTTGDSYSLPAADTSDAIVAMDLKTGAIQWSVQTTADDVWTAGCPADEPPGSSATCGPDIDYGSSAILRDLGNGKRVLLAGQKSGVLHALDPDRNGEILWQKRLSPGGIIGGIEWGFAADAETVYVPISDVWENRNTPGHAGGVYALRINDGEALWQKPAVKPACLDRSGCNAGQPAAAALIPGVLFSASMDGFMRAYDPASGEVIWSVDTGREYDAINGVPTKGGSIKGAGPTVVDGWLYFGSGYGRFGMPGNAFLAFGPKE